MFSCYAWEFTGVKIASKSPIFCLCVALDGDGGGGGGFLP